MSNIEIILDRSQPSQEAWRTLWDKFWRQHSIFDDVINVAGFDISSTRWSLGNVIRIRKDHQWIHVVSGIDKHYLLLRSSSIEFSETALTILTIAL